MFAGEFCLFLGGNAPQYTSHSMGRCSPTNPAQQWESTADGKIANVKNPAMCLGSAPPAQVLGIDQYMVGDSMMVAPVLVAGARSRLVYFPKGARYTHYFTNESYAGGATALVGAPLDHFPLFTVSRSLTV